jgi:hypothetical protein
MNKLGHRGSSLRVIYIANDPAELLHFSYAPAHTNAIPAGSHAFPSLTIKPG